MSSKHPGNSEIGSIFGAFGRSGGSTFARLRGKASTNARRRRRRRPLSLAGGGKFCYLKVQNGHFPYRFEVVILTSKNQKDAHLKMRSIAPLMFRFGQLQRCEFHF
jgi:hypothetical protein